MMHLLSPWSSSYPDDFCCDDLNLRQAPLKFTDETQYVSRLQSFIFHECITQIERQIPNNTDSMEEVNIQSKPWKMQQDRIIPGTNLLMYICTVCNCVCIFCILNFLFGFQLGTGFWCLRLSEYDKLKEQNGSLFLVVVNTHDSVTGEEFRIKLLGSLRRYATSSSNEFQFYTQDLRYV